MAKARRLPVLPGSDQRILGMSHFIELTAIRTIMNIDSNLSPEPIDTMVEESLRHLNQALTRDGADLDLKALGNMMFGQLTCKRMGSRPF